MRNPPGPSPHLGRRQWLALLATTAAGPVLAQQPASRRPAVGVEATLISSGLAARLAEALRRDTGLAIDWRPGPSGLLLPQLERGELDAALVHEPGIEAALVQQNLVHDRRPIAATDLVLVGPAPRRATKKQPASGDPAGVAAGRDGAAALQLIAAAGARGEASFVTHGEPSGSRYVEQQLWKAAGPQPIGAWLRTAGTGPEAVLALARELQAYALVERGLWSARGTGSGLAVLVEGDPRLAVSYHIMLSFRVSHPAGKLMVNWLAGRNGQRVVAGFGRGYRPAG